MIFIKSRLQIIFIVFVYLYLSLTFGMRVNASETQVLKVNEIEKRAVDHLVKALPWDKESLEINVYYQGKDITLPAGKKDLIYKIMGIRVKVNIFLFFLQKTLDFMLIFS